MKIVTAEQMTNIDLRCIESGTPAAVLMENAGTAVAEHIIKTEGDIGGKNVVILAGPGNNGGDGLVAARYLHARKADVSLFLFGKQRENDANLNAARERGMRIVEMTGEEDVVTFSSIVLTSDILIDALLGTGNKRPLGEVIKKSLELVKSICEGGKPIHIFAVDVPTGLNADTGDVDEACLYADETITLAAPKVGLYHLPGAERTGRITVVDIGIPEKYFNDIAVEVNTREKVRPLLPKRPLVSSKGTFGKVLVIAGSKNYIGAAFLACSGAMRTGAGLVTLATAASLHPILASMAPEVTHLPLPESEPGIISPEAVKTILEEVKKYDSLLIGCGLGQSMSVKDFVKTLLLENSPDLPVTVIDADGLNALAEVPEWWRRIQCNGILTPHPGEMARLTGRTVEEIQHNRLDVAKASADTWKKTIILKGAYTVIASPGAASVINPAANPGLASAGTGDVLAGAIAGFLAQGAKAYSAAVCGVYIHAEAGEMVKSITGDAGMIASDLLPKLPIVINKVKKLMDQGGERQCC
jgi:NAD(P)H-hydrate epimerase